MRFWNLLTTPDDDDVVNSRHHTIVQSLWALALTLGSISLAFATFTDRDNNPEQLRTWYRGQITFQYGLLLYCLGFVYFKSLSILLNVLLLNSKRGIQLRQHFQLKRSGMLNISNKLVSAIHAAMSSAMGVYINYNTCHQFMYASSYAMEVYCCFTCAYFSYDLLSMYSLYKQDIAEAKFLELTSGSGDAGDGSGDGIGGFIVSDNRSLLRRIQHFISLNMLMIVHHVFVGAFGLIVATYIRGGGHCIGSYILMMEVSTPLVSLHGILCILRLKHTRLYLFNGILMMIVFFFCRVFMWPYVMKTYSDAVGKTFMQAVLGLPIGCMISILTLFLPQLFWFSLMLRGCLKLLMGKRHRN